MSRGVLVSIRAETEGEISCSCETRVIIWLYARQCADEDALQFVRNHARLRTLSKNQKWCIG